MANSNDFIYKIYPAIGVARVGDSKEFYLGPETSGGMPLTWPEAKPATSDDIFRDAKGDMRRQAARFKIYRYIAGQEDQAEEVTLDTLGITDIQWTVHVANKKSSWYEFETNPGEMPYTPNHPLRNAHITDPVERQKKLITDPGKRAISGRNIQGDEYAFTKAAAGEQCSTFPPENLQPFKVETLGECLTDSSGRLIVTAGHGNSGSSLPPEIKAYANNDHWWDDTADGPVTAEIILADGTTVSAGSAWVLSGPPSYAPQIENLVTLYDTIYDASICKMGADETIFKDNLWQSGPEGYRPDYETEIRPILQRGENYPWVSAIPPKPHRFDYDRLGNPDPTYNGMRQYILDVMRPPGSVNEIISTTNGATLMPYLAGDSSINSDLYMANFVTVTATQYFFLQQWAKGYFTNNRKKKTNPGDALTKAVLDNCVGGAFSPGIEMTWVSRIPEIYSEPFRIKAQQDYPIPLSLGLNYDAGMQPGDITRYMAIPWQADFNECSSQPVNKRYVWWWPAQRPEFAYQPDPDITDPREMQLKGKQMAWTGIDFDQNANNYIMFSSDLEMVEHWKQLGFIHNVNLGKSVEGKPLSPMFVEVKRTLRRADSDDSTIDS